MTSRRTICNQPIEGVVKPIRGQDTPEAYLEKDALSVADILAFSGQHAPGAWAIRFSTD